MFTPDKIDEYSKQELVEFWIKFREEKKKLDEYITMINTALVEFYGIDGKERYWDYNVFERQVISYSVKKDYDYNTLMQTRPDLFVPDKAKMWKEFPDAINRKITNALEISKDKILNTNHKLWENWNTSSGS